MDLLKELIKMLLTIALVCIIFAGIGYLIGLYFIGDPKHTAILAGLIGFCFIMPIVSQDNE